MSGPPAVVGIDTSVAVPLVLRDHTSHSEVSRWARGRRLALAGHAAFETYAVLTRLPVPSRLSAADAATLLGSRFEPTLWAPDGSVDIVDLARLGVVGGAVYDALVASAAAAHDVPLATRDRRARATYGLVGVTTMAVD